jgi:hypothetical protein
MIRACTLLVLLGACARAESPQQGKSDAPVGGDDTAKQIDAAPDIDASCMSSSCDILAQTGCCPAQACDIDTSDLNGSACRKVNHMGHETNICGNLLDCDQGFVCLGPTSASSCKKYCSSNADCAAPRGQCVIDITNGTTPIPGIPSVCSSGCDPANTAAGGCPTGFKCGLFTATHQGTTYNIADCEKVSIAGAQGAACKVGTNGDDTKCASDFLCTTVDSGTNFNCRRICTTVGSAGGVCGGMTCIGFATPLTIAGVQYGVCN